MIAMNEVLEQARVALNNATTDLEVLMALTLYGYGIERLQEGKTLYEAARDSVQMQKDAKYVKLNASQLFQQRWSELQLHYSQDLHTARLALKQDESARSFLQLDGTRAMAYANWREQVRTFYFGLLAQPELQTTVQTLGLTLERVNQGVQLLQALENARSQQLAQKGNAGNVRMQRNEAVDALNEWMITFRQIARIAFAKQPVHLATLGLEAEPRKQKKKDVLLPGIASLASPSAPMLAATLGD